jgi:hypothetical protein
MKVIDVCLPDHHEIILEGDEHRGSLLFMEDGLLSCHDYVMSAPNRYIIKMGDLIEAIMMDDKRMDVRSTKSYLLSQIKDCFVGMLPVKDRIITILDGNHELSAYNKLGENITETWCNELNRLGSTVVYGTYSCVVCVRDSKGKLMYKIFATHGHKGIGTAADDPQRQLANMRLVLKRHLKEKMSDCVIMAKGHAHKLIVTEPVPTRIMTTSGKCGKIETRYMNADNNDRYIHPDHRWYVCTGSFMKLYGNGFSGYAERGEYDPVDLGFCIVKVHDKHVVSVDKVIL